ncbi:MAG TPA: alanine racemase [Thermomicrobiales bacterium]|nr:alanine racemase [Thermomicrobiales bacterium]
MLTSLVGQGIEALDTPALIVDSDALAANISLMSSALKERDTGWRPHAKAHKSPAVAHMLLQAGAHGITCAKTSEAEVYVASGIRDILIANQIVGAIKTRRLAHLARRADIAVAVDCFDNVLEHEAAASEAGTSPRLVIEMNCGMNRAGIAPGEAAVDLARRIAELKHVRFGGVMTWEGHTLGIADLAAREDAVRSSLAPVLETVHAIRDAGIDVPIVSCGGTGTFLTTAGIEGVTEVQAGGGIFGDRFYRDLEVPVIPALGVLVTVTSRPTPTRIIIDAGRKTLDPSNVVPEVVGLDGVTGMSFSAEHGTITLDQPNDDIRVGDRLRLNIGYSDQAVHLHEQMFLLKGDEIDAVLPTLARGRLQ